MTRIQPATRSFWSEVGEWFIFGELISIGDQPTTPARFQV